MYKSFIGIIISLFLWGGSPVAEEAKSPATVNPVNRIYYFDRTNTPTIRIPKNARCSQHWNVLYEAGWKQKDMLMADKIMYRESRCIPSSHNPNDPVTINGVKGSLGLFQINLFWLSKTTSYPLGYLQTVKVAQTPEDLLVPLTNAKAALALFQYSEAVNGCGWQPWAMPCN